jgi:hypothetical protein
MEGTLVQQVLKVALLFPVLGKVLPRDFSPLKPVLVEGVWDRAKKGLVPLSAGGRVLMRDFYNSLKATSINTNARVISMLQCFSILLSNSIACMCL